MDAARLIEKAIYRIQDKKVEFSAFDEARVNRAENELDRLIEEFRPELLKLGVGVVAKDDNPVSNMHFRLGDPIDTQTIYADLRDAKSLHYENQRGLELKDGFNYRTRFGSWIELNDFLSLELEPAVTFADGVRDFDIETGYVKLNFSNVEFEFGRDTMWWGPGYHGSMLLSDNAYPLDLIKIKSAHPFMLPWEKLGKWNIDFFVAQLDEKRDYPHAKLGGLRIECTPYDNLTLGFSRTAIFGGRNRPSMSFGDYWDIFAATASELNQDPNKNNSDQLASLDFKFNILNYQIYGEWAGEDKFAPWENESPGYIAGLLVSDVFDVESLDLRMEYSHADAAWYVHGIYTTGYRYKSDIIGHHMGGDAEDFFVRLSKNFDENQEYFESFTLGGQFDYETHGRSLSYPENKYEAAIDGTFYIADSKAIKLLYEYELYNNFENISGKKTHNNIFEVEANLRF